VSRKSVAIHFFDNFLLLVLKPERDESQTSRSLVSCDPLTIERAICASCRTLEKSQLLFLKSNVGTFWVLPHGAGHHVDNA
jgi:hypothetical protein